MNTIHYIDNGKEEKKEKMTKILCQNNFDAKRKAEDRGWRRMGKKGENERKEKRGKGGGKDGEWKEGGGRENEKGGGGRREKRGWNKKSKGEKDGVMEG